MRKIILTLIFVLILFLLNLNHSFATTLNGPAPHFASEDEILINNTINGDTFLMGQNISITQPVNGDLYLIGENVAINAPITGDVRVIASNLEVKSQISGSLAFIADKVQVTEIGEIGTDAYGLASKFNLYGRIGRDLNLGYAQDADIIVDGNIVGNIHYLNALPNVSNQAYLGGQLIKTSLKDLNVNESQVRIQIIISKILHSLSLILIVILAIRFVPKKFARTYELYITNYRQNLWHGLISIFVFPLIILALLFSIIGAPIALIISALLAFAIYLSPIYVGIWVGKKILPQSKNLLIQAICGIFIFDVVSMGPIIGGVLYTLSIVTFLGLVFKALLGLRGLKASK